MNLPFVLQRWAAWAPGVQTPQQWQDWAAGRLAITADDSTPPLAFINPMLRRRLSRLSRLALEVAYACAGGDHALRTVFASRHGEIHRTRSLLADLAAGEPLSPMAFSLSVHNTASGLYSIASGNTAPSTAIAAGRDTLAMAVIEAVGQLAHAKRVMVVFADEPLPEDYRAFADESTAPFGLALLLGRAGTGTGWTLSTAPLPPATAMPECAGLQLLRLLAGGGRSLTTAGERSGWCWSCP